MGILQRSRTRSPGKGRRVILRNRERQRRKARVQGAIQKLFGNLLGLLEFLFDGLATPVGLALPRLVRRRLHPQSQVVGCRNLERLSLAASLVESRTSSFGHKIKLAHKIR